MISIDSTNKIKGSFDRLVEQRYKKTIFRGDALTLTRILISWIVDISRLPVLTYIFIAVIDSGHKLPLYLSQVVTVSASTNTVHLEVNT